MVKVHAAVLLKRWSAQLVIFMLFALVTRPEASPGLVITWDLPKHPLEAVQFFASFYATEEFEYEFRWRFVSKYPGPDDTTFANCTVNTTCTSSSFWNFDKPGHYDIHVSVFHKLKLFQQNHTDFFYPARIEYIVFNVPTYAATNRSTAVSATVSPPQNETGPIHFVWNFGNGRVINSSIPLAITVYDHLGPYDLTLTASNPFSVIQQQAHLSVEDPVELVSFDVTSKHLPAPARIGLNITVLGTSPEYFWDFGDGKHVVGVENRQFHNYNDSGKYDVNVTVLNHVSQLSTSLTIDVYDPPPPAEKPAIAVSASVIVVLIVVLIFSGYRYHRWLFKQRGVEVADHEFSQTPERRRPPSRRSVRELFGFGKPKQYGTVEMFDL